MSFCCKLAPNEHEDTCANNPKNFGSHDPYESVTANTPDSELPLKKLDQAKFQHLIDRLKEEQGKFERKQEGE